MKNNISRYLIIGFLLLIAAASLFLGWRYGARYLGESPTATPPVTETPHPTTTPTSTATATPSPTWTPLPTLTPTLTLTPTITPTPTPSPLPPTLTPAYPPQDKATYRLHPWSPQHANNLIFLMEAYPDTLSEVSQQAYFEAYYYAYLAQAEGILRYPDFAAQELWSWDKAYNLARLSSPLAASEYAALISQALQQGATEPAALEQWIQRQDPRLDPKMYDPEGLDGSTQVLELENAGGSATLLLKETESNFKVSALSSDFDFSAPPKISYLWSDFTQDGTPELILINNDMPRERVPLPHVFDIAGQNPKTLNFAPDYEIEMGLGHSTRWSTQLPGERPILEVSSSVYPPCPTDITRRYQWNGEWLEETQVTYEVNPALGLEHYCEDVVNHAVQAWGLNAGIDIMEGLLPEWPPQTTSTGQTYPLDEKDEWRFRLGVYHAQAGNSTQAKEYFTEVINHPSSAASSWIQPSQAFLGTLADPKTQYQLCSQTPFCDPRIALQNWIANISTWNFNQLLSVILYSSRSTMIENGTHDFNDDGLPEGWAILQHDSQRKPEFWIFAFDNGKAQALFVDTFESAEPILTHYITRSGTPLIWLNRQKSFSLETLPEGGFFIKFYAPSYYYADYASQVVRDAYLALFNGFSPSMVRDDLLNLRNSPSFVCLNPFACGNFSYALGLAYELGGEKEKARDVYYTLWEEYPDSPFALMARLKIDPGTIATPTFTSTVTPTTTPSPTLTPTITPSPTMTTTPTVTWTPTITHTPSPTTAITSTNEPYP